MIIKEADINDLDRLLPGAPSVYDTVAFAALNAAKAERVTAFVGTDGCGTPVAAQIFGLRDGIWRAPFSAPFSAPRVAGGTTVDLTDFYRSISQHTSAPLKIVLPPELYRHGESPVPDAFPVIRDANFHYDMARFADYEHWLSRSGRYSHHRGLKTAWTFEKTGDIPRAYAVIEANRHAMGYPLAMSLDQVIATVSGPVEADFFVLSHEGKDLAAAMIYHVTADTVQVIYWGDLPEARPLRAMNHLAWRVFGWYAANRPDIRIVDIGPSSSDGVRNEGLCQFKLSVGCTETIRPTLTVHPDHLRV